MNYSVLVTGAVIGFSVLYYFPAAHKVYKGPLIDAGTMMRASDKLQFTQAAF